MTLKQTRTGLGLSLCLGLGFGLGLGLCLGRGLGLGLGVGLDPGFGLDFGFGKENFGGFNFLGANKSITPATRTHCHKDTWGFLALKTYEK